MRPPRFRKHQPDKTLRWMGSTVILDLLFLLHNIRGLRRMLLIYYIPVFCTSGIYVFSFDSYLFIGSIQAEQSSQESSEIY